MRIDRETSAPWIEIAHKARILQDLLGETAAATPQSRFGEVDRFYPLESAERWCRSYLSAALEHLVMWADLVAPLKLHPEAELHHSLRPAQTLARAALESASQAVWIMSADHPRELARRHLSLVLEDWNEQQKAAIDRNVRAALTSRRQAILDVFEPVGIKLHAPSYLTLVTSAAETVRTTLDNTSIGDKTHVERLWRASAGAAHGKMWPSLELTTSVEVSGRTYSFPDPSAMAAMLSLAEAVTSFGVLRFVANCGRTAGFTARFKETTARWYEMVPKIPGAPDSLPTDFLDSIPFPVDTTDRWDGKASSTSR